MFELNDYEMKLTELEEMLDETTSLYLAHMRDGLGGVYKKQYDELKTKKVNLLKTIRKLKVMNERDKVLTKLKQNDSAIFSTEDDELLILANEES